ncbi:hypothetical protein ABTL03_19380, partial [Acinetobacter baumannii]
MSTVGGSICHAVVDRQTSRPPLCRGWATWVVRLCVERRARCRLGGHRLRGHSAGATSTLRRAASARVAAGCADRAVRGAVGN